MKIVKFDKSQSESQSDLKNDKLISAFSRKGGKIKKTMAVPHNNGLLGAPAEYIINELNNQNDTEIVQMIILVLYCLSMYKVTRYKNKSVPNKTWLPLADTLDFLGDTTEERADKWKQFYDQGIIWYHKNN